ncbi:MAG: hypothetical protein OXI60_04655 [Acidiferrobacterales bacterium]|nr:hypothetical protein [Acidiferrobacterales bacterium]
MNTNTDDTRPRNTEPSVNVALANALKSLHPDWDDSTLHSERTNVLRPAGSRIRLCIGQLRLSQD